MNRFFKLALATSCVLLSAGCASTGKLPIGPSTAEVYDQVHRSGAKDAVELLSSGLKKRMSLGHSDPIIPMRTPDQVVPVWVVAHKDHRTHRYVEGNWEHAVVEESEWFIAH